MENQKQSRHSQTIKGIEQSLMLLKSKIEHMQKEDERNISNIDKVFSSSIPILKNKFNQTQKMEMIEKKKHAMRNISESKFKEINQNKLKLDNKNRQALKQAKATESQHIKEMSKKNDEIIENVKQKYREENRKKKELIRQNKQRSKEKVQQYYIFKKYDLKKRKNNENNEISKKLKTYYRQVEELEKQEKVVSEKMKRTQYIFKKLRYAVDKLSKMKEEEFKCLIDEIGLQNINDIKDSTLDRILNQINARKKQQRSQSVQNSKAS